MKDRIAFLLIAVAAATCIVGGIMLGLKPMAIFIFGIVITCGVAFALAYANRDQ